MFFLVPTGVELFFAAFGDLTWIHSQRSKLKMTMKAMLIKTDAILHGRQRQIIAVDIVICPTAANIVKIGK